MRKHIRIEGPRNIHPESTFEAPCALLGGIENRSPIRIGAFSYSYSLISPFVAEIGRYCSIGSGVTFGEMEHPVDWITTSNITYDSNFWASNHPVNDLPPEPRRLGIRIGNDVWIGAKSYIRGGVTIGTGAIIGYGAVVTKDVPPFAIIIGNPGRILRFRFSQEMMDLIMVSRWWRFNVLNIAQLAPDPRAFIQELERINPPEFKAAVIMGADL